MRILRLKDIGVFYTGLSGKSKNDFSNGNALFVTYSNIFNNPVLDLNITDTVIVKEGEKQNEVKCGDILFTGSSETPDEAGMSSVVLSVPKEKMYLNSFCFGYRLNNIDEISPAYMGYILRSASIRNAISKTAFGVTRFNINKNKFADIEVPIPSLSTQQKIVSVLDSFTTLIDKMKQEVEKRKKQMEYYREKLLTFKDGECEWKTLGDIATLSRGRVISKDYLRDNSGEYPVYSSQTANNGELGKINTFDFDGLYLTWTTDGAYAGTIFRREGKFNITNVCGLIDITVQNVNRNFAYYWLSKTAKEYVYEGMGNPKLMSNVMSTVRFPIPSLEKQSEIVSTLDKFESYITKLEKTIEFRQKQYEYYREQLLTFE